MLKEMQLLLLCEILDLLSILKRAVLLVTSLSVFIVLAHFLEQQCCGGYIYNIISKSKFAIFSFIEFVVCEDEIKHALLASNCVCPGISTFVTLLLHTLHEQ